MDIEVLSEENKAFWNELCGTYLAKKLGITDDKPESLEKFDNWYFDFYPYLFDHIPFDDLKNKKVLEVGLGYGTVSQKIASVGANFYGLDIALGPVEMVNHRLQQMELEVKAIQGSILEPPFKSSSFDAIIAIGCLHHTGDLEKAIGSCWDLLKPGGSLIFMVYYAYSYRRWNLSPLTTAKYLFKELSGYRGAVGGGTSRNRAAYDRGSDGEAAPHTDWISTRSLHSLCYKFTKFSSKIENMYISSTLPFTKNLRRNMLKTKFTQRVGVDIYVTATK